MTASLSYPVIVPHVREISLFGTANLEYWRKQLSTYNLYPSESSGCAQILISATTLKWMNVSFRECVFAIMLSKKADGSTNDGSFLLHAFNSNRFFAAIERQSFATPYYHAAIDFEIDASRFQVRVQNETVISALRRDTAPMRKAEESFGYAVVLPPMNQKVHVPQKFFAAKISGATQIAPFAADDELTLQASPKAPVIRHLCESHFVPIEWHIRTDATHSKSNTLTIGKDARSAFEFPPH